MKGGTLWSRPVWYVTRKNRKNLFGSLGQIVQFGAIIFCRTFRNYFGQFVWIEKKSHYNSRVSLHEAPTTKSNSRVLSSEVPCNFVDEIKWFHVKNVQRSAVLVVTHFVPEAEGVGSNPAEV